MQPRSPAEYCQILTIVTVLLEYSDSIIHNNIDANQYRRMDYS